MGAFVPPGYASGQSFVGIGTPANLSYTHAAHKYLQPGDACTWLSAHSDLLTRRQQGYGCAQCGIGGSSIFTGNHNSACGI